MPRRSSQSQSRASTSSQNCLQRSQPTIDQHFGPPETEISVTDQVSNCVRYFVNNAGQNAFFRRGDIQKYCGLKGGSLVQDVINQATVILKNVYGYNVLACDQAAGKGYIVSNALPYKNYNVNNDEPDPKEVQKILLLLILSHVFMSNNLVSEAGLHTFLNLFDIDVNVRHPLFGNVKDYIMNTLVKQKFLSTDTDPVSKKTNFSWGTRAEKEIRKHDIIKFVCKMFKDCQPTSWSSQYQIASEQEFFNNKLTEVNTMDVDED